MSVIDQVVELVNDPYDGPEEGVDFWIDEQGLIQVQNVRTAALIMRKANISEMFDQKLVKMGQRGDSVLLGFDTLLEVEPVHTARIGFMRDTIAEVKQDEMGKFCVYLNKKRMTRMFNKLSAAKTYLKKLDKDLQQEALEPDAVDE